MSDTDHTEPTASSGTPALRPTTRGRERTLGRDDAVSVIRRAAELDHVEPLVDDRLDRDALEEAAREAGISVDALRQALAEHDADTLVVSPKATKRGLLGPAYASAERIVTVRPDVAQAALERWLKKQTYELRRRQGPAARWERRQDLTATMKRRLDFSKRIKLDDPDEVVSVVVPLGDDRSLVRLHASFVHLRQGLLSGMVGFPVVAGPAVGAVAGFATGAIAMPLIGIPAGLAIAAVGGVGGRRVLRDRKVETVEILAGFLDDLELG